MGRGNVDFFWLRFHAAFCNLLIINVSKNGAWPRPAGKVTAKGKGVRRETAPLSPLLSNTVLNELDKELERRGLITGSSASSRKTPDVRLPDGGNPVDAMAEK